MLILAATKGLLNEVFEFNSNISNQSSNLRKNEFNIPNVNKIVTEYKLRLFLKNIFDVDQCDKCMLRAAGRVMCNLIHASAGGLVCQCGRSLATDEGKLIFELCLLSRLSIAANKPCTIFPAPSHLPTPFGPLKSPETGLLASHAGQQL